MLKKSKPFLKQNYIFVLKTFLTILLEMWMKQQIHKKGKSQR